MKFSQPLYSNVNIPNQKERKKSFFIAGCVIDGYLTYFCPV